MNNQVNDQANNMGRGRGRGSYRNASAMPGWARLGVRGGGNSRQVRVAISETQGAADRQRVTTADVEGVVEPKRPADARLGSSELGGLTGVAKAPTGEVDNEATLSHQSDVGVNPKQPKKVEELLGNEEFDEDSPLDKNTKSRLPLKPVYMMMEAKTVKEFNTDYGIEPILKPSNPIHLHPHLAHQRNWCELRAMKHCDREYGNVLVCDVGSAARTARANWNVHCLVPNFQPGDDQRFKECLDAKHLMNQETKVCRHSLQECDCAEFGALLFTHSAYYFNKAEFFDALFKTTTKTAYVIGHLFEESVGSFAYGEGGYRYIYQNDNVLVETRVKGNHHPYVHPPLLWDNVDYVDHAYGSLDVQILEKVGQTYLWRVQLVPRRARIEVTPDESWSEQLINPKYKGPIMVPGYDKTTKQGLSANGHQTISVDHVYGYGPTLFAVTRVGTVMIPRGIVYTAAASVLGLPRNAATMKDVVHNMQNALKTCRLTEVEKLRALTIGSAFAFMCNVQNEVDVMNTVTGRFDWLNKVHGSLVGMTPLGLWSIMTFIYATVFGLVFNLIVYFSIDFDHHILGLVGLGVWGLIVSARICIWGVARYRQTRAAETWSIGLYNERKARSVEGLHAPLLQSRYPMTDEFVPPIIDLERGDLSYEAPDPTRRRLDAPPPDDLRAGGIVFANAVPQAAYDCIDAERSGITNRVLVGPTIVVREAFELFRMGIDAASISLEKLNNKLNVTRNDFDDWMASDKWSASIKDKFMKYYAKCKDKTPYDTWHKLFVKVEKNKTMTLFGVVPLKPRIISGPFDGVKVMVGPYISRIYSMVRSLWDGSPIEETNGAILYCSGMTPDAIGSKVHKWIVENGGLDAVIGVAIDFTVFDSTLQNELLSERERYLAMGMPEKAYEWLVRSRSGGSTKHGGKVRMAKKVVVKHGGKDNELTSFEQDEEEEIQVLSSGEMDTNLIGTIINARAVTTFLNPAIKFLMLVCGDDNFLLFRRDEFKNDDMKVLERGLIDLGLKPTFIISPNFWDWEFCSKLFWFATDRQTGVETMVLGPKPMRWLHRIGWNLSLPGALNFRGAMISSQHDVQHIPLLRGYVVHALKLTRGMKAIGKEHSEIKHVSKAFDMSDKNWIILRERYGLTEVHEQDFEQLLAKVETVPSVVQWERLIDQVRRDE